MPAHAPKVVVITGGSAGVGRATANVFAEAGADVAIIARGPDRPDATRQDIERFGRRVLAISGDVAEADQIDEAASRIEAELGPIDCWVNNAMTTVFAPVMKIAPVEFARVTYLGVMHGTRAALRWMMARDRGMIIQVGSALAFRGIPLQGAYCAAKHAMLGFTESMRSELAHEGSGVRMTMVHLPSMNTPQFDWVLSRLEHKAQPVPPIYNPEVAAGAIVRCNTHRRRSIMVGFPTLKTVWGNRIASWHADRVLARQSYGGQQTDEPEPPDGPASLWEPVPGDFAAHGRFDARARSRSWFTPLSQYPVLAGAVGRGGLLIAIALIWLIVAAF